MPWADDWDTLVFVNGRHCPTLSSFDECEGVTVARLSTVVESNGAVAQQHLGTLASVKDDGFAALNTAFISDGALVHVTQGARVERPIHLVFVSTDEDGFAAHPRVLVVAGRESECTIIESYVGLGDNDLPEQWRGGDSR